MAHRSLLVALWLGVLTQILVQGYDRFLYVKFPLNLFGTLFLAFTMLGAGAGALASRWGERNRALLEPLFAGSLVLFLVGLCLNRNVSVHFLLANQYYPYPRPTHWEARTVGLVVSWIGSATMLAFVVGAWARALARAVRPSRTVAIYAAGLALGGGVSYFANATLGPYRLLLLWGVVALAFLGSRHVKIAGIVVIAMLAVVSEHRVPALKSSWTAPAPFLWRQNDHVLQSRHWTPTYKLDFVSFKDDRCMGGVYNNLMLWYHCDDPDLLPNEISAIFRVSGADRKSVLAIGRVDSMYLSLLERWHGPLERSLSLEFDQTVVDEVTGPYKRYFNDRWDDPRHEARAGNLRTMLDDIDETFDIVYLNGQMIRLYLQPHMLLPQEDYLFARDYLEKMRDKLNPGGLMIVDWGSSQEEELYDVVSNIPEGMHAAAFWSTMSNLPMAGLPLFFVMVSEDAGTVQQIAADLQALGMDEERARVMPIDPKLRTPVDDQDKPFLQEGVTMGFTLVPLMVLVPLVLLLAWAGFRRPILGLLSREPGARARIWAAEWHRSYYVLVGLLLGAFETLVVGRYSTAHPMGSPMGAALLLPVFLGGLALGALAAERAAENAWARVAGALGSALLALTLGTVLPDSLGAVAVASAGLGGAVGFAMVALLAGLDAERRASAWGWQAVGAAVSLVAFQPAMIQLGFRGLAIALGTLTLLVVIWLARRLAAEAPERPNVERAVDGIAPSTA